MYSRRKNCFHLVFSRIYSDFLAWEYDKFKGFIRALVQNLIKNELEEKEKALKPKIKVSYKEAI